MPHPYRPKRKHRKFGPCTHCHHTTPWRLRGQYNCGRHEGALAT